MMWFVNMNCKSRPCEAKSYLLNPQTNRVAIDRGLRLAEKRQLPLGGPRRQKWLDARDALYEEIQVSTCCLIRSDDDIKCLF